MRPPTIADFDAWVELVFDHADEIDPDEGIDWNDMALGFLLARGVDHTRTGWELLSSFTCGDRSRALAALGEDNAS